MSDSDETLHASRAIAAPADAIFAVLADPTLHAAIDGTGWVRGSHEGEKLTSVGQVFRVDMFHPNHPDGSYVMANRVEVLDPAVTIAWKPGQDAEGGDLHFGGWVWRYDLTPDGSATTVTLTYDWSGVPEPIRQHIGFPPFPKEHLDNSLAHLAELVERTTG